ncbi:MAG: PIG-L family deacetylase [Archangium sp.]|nr:PIG-L family deacetylase [Archangium sp.]
MLLGCVPDRPHHTGVDVLVIAPHPDDEVLLAAGAMDRAITEGRRVAVIIVTNGDYSCERDGYLREAESITALKTLGVQEADVHFLGYPDGALARLTATPLPPMEHRDATGQCIARTGTYADRRAGRLDEHTARTGKPAEWTSEALTGDLEALLTRLNPAEVYLPHGIDDHPDHAMSYVFFRRALDRLTTAPAVVHRGIVHAGECWPSDCRTYFAPALPTPPLPGRLAGYLATERFPVNAQRKLDAITRYTSQLSPWLTSFARKDETFFPESYERIAERWVRTEGSQRPDGARLNREGEFEEVARWSADGFEGVEVRRP